MSRRALAAAAAALGTALLIGLAWLLFPASHPPAPPGPAATAHAPAQEGGGRSGDNAAPRPEPNLLSGVPLNRRTRNLPVPRTARPEASGPELSAPEAISGILLEGDTQRPIAGAAAIFRMETAASTTLQSAVSDGEGQFLLENPPSQPFTLKTRVPGYLPDLRRVDAPDAATARLTLLLQRALSIQGTVSDAAGNPLQGAELRLTRLEGSGLDAARARSAADGKFFLDGLDAGDWILEARLKGFRTPAPRPVQAPPVEALRVILEAERPAPILVLDPMLQPAAGAVIRLSPAGGAGAGTSTFGGERRFRTDAAGAADLDGLPADPGATLRLSVEHPAFQPFEARIAAGELEARAGGGPYRVVLAAGSSISGSVLDAGGAPAAETRLFLDGPARREGVSIADGSFQFSRLPPGVYSVEAQGGRRGWARAEGVGLDPAGGPALPAPALIIRLSNAGGSLGGRILDAGGRPLARVPVQAVPSGGGRGAGFFTQSDAGGEFLLAGIPEGGYRLRAGSWRTGVRTVEGASTGSPPAEIILPPLCEVAGMVSSTGPLSPYSIRFIPASDGGAEDPAALSYRFTSRTLSFRCPAVPEGTYDVILEQDGGEAARLPGKTIRKGAPEILEFRLSSGR